MILNKVFATQNECYKAGARMAPKGLMIHSTGANNPWLKRYVQPDDGKLGKNPYNNSFNTPKPGGSRKCVHAFAGKLENGQLAIYQILPWTMQAWHCGKGPKGSGNRGYISIEMCEDNMKDPKYFNDLYALLVEFAAYICKEFKISPSKPDLICHSEGHDMGIASNHSDVMHWFPKHGKSMDTFRADVKKLLTKPIPQKPPAPQKKEELYRVRKSKDDAESQLGAYANEDNAIKIAKANRGYSVFDQNGRMVHDGTIDNIPIGRAIPFTAVYALPKYKSAKLMALAPGNNMELLGVVHTFYKVRAVAKKKAYIGYVPIPDVRQVSGKAFPIPVRFKSDKPLRRGMNRNAAVEIAQAELKRQGYYTGVLDGDFGPITERAVKGIQLDAGLRVTGVINNATAEALGGEIG